jgi:NADH-quinone oxidoreductase subunit J
MEVFVFVVSAAIILSGALGVVLRSHPVHAALSLVQTLFGIAVLFVALEAHFLAAVQVIVYAGAIVVLFLFVIMLLGVDRAEDMRTEPLVAQRPAAVVLGAGIVGLVIAAIGIAGWGDAITGDPALGGQIDPAADNVAQLATSLFSQYHFAFQLTSALLIIAVLGAVVLARRPPRDRVTPSVEGGV